MKTYTPEELKDILAKHKLYRDGDSAGVRADLRSANLYGANLRSADLRSANLYGANLGGADLRSADLGGADLRSANLRSADLRSANLYGANLRSANLRSADLRSANLYGADLRSANLYGANLGGADLRSADLGGANLGGADLRSADLGGANLRSADLRSADLGGANLGGADLRSADLGGANLRSADLEKALLPDFQIIPQEGQFYGWKKAYREGSFTPVVLKLEILHNASRTSSLIGRKCRASAVLPVAAFELDGKPVEGGRFCSSHDSSFIYEIGKIARPATDFDPDVRIECTSGIHFFVTRAEAENYGR